MNEEMESFEGQVRAALQRECAPEDFAARLLAKTRVAEAQMKPKPKVVALAGKPSQRWAVWSMAAAVALAAITPPVVSEYRRREEARAQDAERQLMVALNITRAKLQLTRERIQRKTRHAL